jgi:hypothetical protein
MSSLMDRTLDAVPDAMLVATVRDPVAADFATYCRQLGERVRVTAAPEVVRLAKEDVKAGSQADRDSMPGTRRCGRLVLFLDRTATAELDRHLDEVSAGVCEELDVACVVSSWRAHLGDQAVNEAEVRACRRLASKARRLLVFRPSNVLSANARLTRSLRQWGGWLQLAPEDFGTCVIDAAELFAAVLKELKCRTGRPTRTYTLLGPHTPWRKLAPPHVRPDRAWVRSARHVTRTLAAIGLLRLVGALATKCIPCWRGARVHTLYPTSHAELLAIYNPYNWRHVQVVGYNNGVTHFGQRYPGKTVVSTLRCARPARIRDGFAKLDAGLTLRQADLALAARGKELFVVPNFLYVSAGTAFFVPIHGSACAFSTLGETIDKVVLYDPRRDRFLVSRRGDAAFNDHMYDRDTAVVLLRLYVKIRDRSPYYARRENWSDPSSERLIRLFEDSDAANVEVRKASAGSRTVTVMKYYTQASAADTGCGLPRDRLGSLWDRIEEHRLAALAFHGLSRRLAHHVELFLTKDQFARFWDTHSSLPLRKIQLRYVRRDGLPRSPFRHEDQISADLFMLKSHRESFHRYLRDCVGPVRLNPGKHSM